MKTALICVTLLFMVPAAAHAQRFEIDPYAGGFFSGKAANLYNVKNQGIYGIKAGMFTSANFEFESNLGYVHDIAFQGTLTQKKAYIWEGLATYNFTRPSKFYGSFGLGGVTTKISGDTVDFWGDAIPSRNTYLALSYGGGIKTFRLWGPVGYRFDVRGRTLPNYDGFAYTWLETTGGLTFSWGDR